MLEANEKYFSGFPMIYGATNSTGVFATFAREFVPASDLNQPLYAGLSINLSYAYRAATGGFLIHDHTGAGVITFGSINSTSSFIKDTKF